MNIPTRKEVMFALTQVECHITLKILTNYIKGLEQERAESTAPTNQHQSKQE